MIKVKEFVEFTHRLDGEFHPIDTQINDFFIN